MNKKHEIYYGDISNWNSVDYDVIDRIFSNIISDYGINSRGEKLKEIDLSLVDTKIKALLYCVVIFHGREDLLDLPNLLELKTIKPLDDTLIINEKPMNLKGKRFERYPIYEKMNVRY